MKNIYEFLVWDNCNNNCQFCWQREKPRIYNHNEREIILNKVLEFIDSDKFEKGSHVLICGGEIFDKPRDFSILDNFFQKIINLMLEKTIELLYINTNLIYKDTTGLFNLLELINNNNLFDRLRFTTSYDTVGRFLTEDIRQLMLSNLKNLQKYPDIKIVVNTILTKPCCESILEDKFNVKQFMEEYNCWVNLVPYIVLDGKLCADRSTIFKTLRYVDNMCTYLEKYIPNITIKQNKWLYMYKDGKFQFCSCDMSECGHSINFKKYSDKGTCFCCDLLEVFDGT